MFKIRYVALLFTAALTACSSYGPTIPANYSGPQAQLNDTSKIYSAGKAEFYVAEQINGTTINNIYEEISNSFYEKSLPVEFPIFSRPLIAERPARVKVLGRTYFAPGVFQATNDAYSLKGTIDFVPKHKATYVIKGQLSAKYSAIWIEDAKTHQVVGNKVERGEKEIIKEEEEYNPPEPPTE